MRVIYRGGQVRVAAEVLGSNGSSSMATACAATLACLDAGVPLTSPVAGVSIGLVSRPRQAPPTAAAGASLGSDGGRSSNGSGGAGNSASGGGGEGAALSADGPVVRFPRTSSKDADRGEDLEYVLLADILGLEDHYGDMDFKVAGSRKGVTAVQLDVKLQGGVPLHVLEEAIDLAATARNTILDAMEVMR
jgi:polyribonucleotide nucleotidyltransferase